jgi:hypothetical protein
MTPSWQLELKMTAKIFLRPENKSKRSSNEIWPLVVFIRHDSAEIWGLGMDPHLSLVL